MMAQRLATVMGGLFDSVASEGLTIARRRSSGPFTAADMRRLNHPFARRHARPGLDPSNINERTGRFRGGWQKRSSGNSAMIVNETAYADFLERGTRNMHARRVGEAVESELRSYVTNAETKVERLLRF